MPHYAPHARLLAPDAQTIAEAAALLRAGGLVGMPTETVYGLAGDATSDRAVAAIYAAKGRPAFNPLIAHFATIAAARREAVFSAAADALAQAFWPGPLTIVAPAVKGGAISLLARAGLDTLALRLPAHPVARALIEAAGRPLAAPSANRSGRLSPTSAAHVIEELGERVGIVLDAGTAQHGLESTILACIGEEIRLLRPGAIPLEAIEAQIGRPLKSAAGGAIAGPGMLASHYAPRAALRLQAQAVELGEIGLDFADALRGRGQLDLSPAGDLQEAAANLYSYLRRLDAAGAAAIAVAPIPPNGLGAAINDRLRRAAAPRGGP